MRGGVDLPGNRSAPSPAYQGGENTANEKVGLHIQFDPVTFLSLTGGASISNYAQYHKISEYISVLNLMCESSSGKGSFQKRFSGFFPLRGYPPPYPLNGKSFCQKTLSGKGG